MSSLVKTILNSKKKHFKVIDKLCLVKTSLSKVG